MINIIVAYAKNRVIGSNDKIPWNIPGEQKQFKELTTNNIVIMGRKTYESIGKALPNRINYVISRKKYFNDVFTFTSLSEAIEHAKRYDRDIYIIGGETIYKQAIDYLDIDRFYITEIDMDVDGNKYFPEFNECKYNKKILKSDNSLYKRYLYIKK